MMRPRGAEFQQVSECHVRRRSLNWRALGMTSTTMDSGDVAGRVNAFDWPGFDVDLQARGAAVLEFCLTASECGELAALYDDDHRFRSRVVMERHGFGRGEYRYFSYPLPPIVGALRTALYARLAPIANRWNERLTIDTRFPDTHAEYLAGCHAAAQTKPTPL